MRIRFCCGLVKSLPEASVAVGAGVGGGAAGTATLLLPLGWPVTDAIALHRWPASCNRMTFRNLRPQDNRRAAT